MQGLGIWQQPSGFLLLFLLPLLASPLLRNLGLGLMPYAIISPISPVAVAPDSADSWPLKLHPSWRRLTAQGLLDKWAAVPGKHPLCQPENLRREIESLPPAPPDDARPLTMAGLTVFVRHPLPIRNALTANFSKMLEKMRTTWPSQETHFLIPFAADHIFLFSRGTGIDCELLSAFLDMGWTRMAPAPATRCNEGGGDVIDASGIYRSRRGTRIIVRGHTFELPRYLEANLEVLQNEEWLNCGKRRDLSYVLSLSAYAHHVLEEPALDAYGAYMKLDLDTLFRSTPPADPRELLETCALAYFKLYPDESCNTGAHDALNLFSEITGLPIASRGAPWFETGTWFYGLCVSSLFATNLTRLFFPHRLTPLTIFRPQLVYGAHLSGIGSRQHCAAHMALRMCGTQLFSLSLARARCVASLPGHVGKSPRRCARGGRSHYNGYRSQRVRFFNVV